MSQQLRVNLGSRSADLRRTETRFSVSVALEAAIGRSLCLTAGLLSVLRPRPPPPTTAASTDSAGAESLTLVLVFTPAAAAFEVGLRELLRSVSATSNVSLI